MQESFTAPDGRKATLWPDVYTAMAAAKRAYGASTSLSRRERGWIFRGQANVDWPLTPSLYRHPTDNETIAKRTAYARQFFEHFSEYSPAVGVKDADEAKCLAVAQHYGFCTDYLDFTWDVDVAAYFATAGNRDFEVAVIYMYNVSKYKEMFEFSKHIASRDDADELAAMGWGPMPPLRLEEFTDVPRIAAQEGIFAQVPRGAEKTILRQCIDRIYLRQHPGLVYKGQLQERANSLLNRSAFSSSEVDRRSVDLVRAGSPGVFERGPSVTVGRIFPFEDSISDYVLTWRLFNPDLASSTKVKGVHLQDGDDITLNGLLPSRQWLGELAELLRFLRGRPALFVLPDLSFLASLIRSVRLILFGEQPNVVGLKHYKPDTEILEMDRFLYDCPQLYSEIRTACTQKRIVLVIVNEGSVPISHLELIRHVSAGGVGQNCTVLFVTSGQNLYHNRNLPANFGEGRILWFSWE